ncbi:MAG: hypothetical protein IAG10_26280, partial [Planctomycetaceae bacterium]|nr:hypothetical protein [Planctomycetaceae bacterium]
MKRFSLKHGLSLLTVACLLALAPAFAQDRAKTEVKSTNKANSDLVKEQGQSEKGQAHSEQVAIPECLKKLNLTSQQQDQVKEIVQNYDASLGMVWKQYSGAYMKTISLETGLMAAIEDNLTESQRQQVRRQRHMTAQQEKAQAASNPKSDQAPVKPNADTRKATQTAEKSTDATAKPAQAVEEGLAAAGITLTDEQEAAAEKVQDKYRSQLRSMNRNIGRLHMRLVSLEADKLVEIEKVLTKEQLTQLRMNRQNAPEAQNVA